MLRKLTISNYALIDRLETEFGPGLSVITGETGAGKSIMLGAISLLLGGRADTRSIRRKDTRTMVEAVFSDPPEELCGIIEEAGPEWSPYELIIRRELSPTGRSRAFINDTPVTLQTLQAVSPSLIDIHSQHHNLLLADSRHQLSIVDTMAGNSKLRDEYHRMFGEYVKLRQYLETARRELDRTRENREFLLFQLEQLDKLKPLRGELEEVERRFGLLSDAGEIKEQLSLAAGLTGGYERSALSLLSEARVALGRIDLSLFEDIRGDGPGVQQRLENLYIELKDLSETLGSFASEVEDDPETLSRVADRMDKLYEAQKRFKVSSYDELVSFHEELRRRVDPTDDDASRLSEVEAELRSLARQLKDKASELSTTRVKAAEEFSDLLTATAIPLGLPNLKFSAMVSKGRLHSDGMDRVSFLCRFNKNQELIPLDKAASGGEMSRLMLSLKEILSTRLRQPTVIFDEIDTGVSGEIADRMGRMMRNMGKGTQVIAITHLPQVASKGERHYRVYKTDVADSTLTRVSVLSDEERRLELAKMLSGDQVDDAALRNAASLLSR